MSREVKILVVLLIILGIVFGALAYLNFKPKQKIIDSEEIIINDLRFEEAVTKFDTSRKLIDYLNKNFTIEDKDNDKIYTPQEFFQKKRGGVQDFAVFSAYVLNQHKYEAGIIRYKYENGINSTVVFRDIDLPKTITFTSERISIYPHGWSFEEMFQKEEERFGIKINEYAVSYWTDKGELWPEEWQER